jgi:hypothetical protein
MTVYTPWVRSVRWGYGAHKWGGDAGAVISSMRECGHLLRSLLLPTGLLVVVSTVDHMADPQRPTASTFAIREAREDDWPQIWPIIHEVITEQQTFAYDPAMSEDDAKRGWLLPAPARVVVAADGDLYWVPRTCTRTGPVREATSRPAA